MTYECLKFDLFKVKLRCVLGILAYLVLPVTQPVAFKMTLCVRHLPTEKVHVVASNSERSPKTGRSVGRCSVLVIITTAFCLNVNAISHYGNVFPELARDETIILA